MQSVSTSCELNKPHLRCTFNDPWYELEFRHVELEKIQHERLKTHFQDIKELEPKRRQGLFEFLRRQDVLAILPTGMGKSLMFQIVPPMCRRLSRACLDYPPNPIVIVICPIVISALIESHMEEVERRGIRANSPTSETAKQEDIERGVFRFVYTSPETLCSGSGEKC